MKFPVILWLRKLWHHPASRTGGRCLRRCAHWMRYVSVALALLVVIGITALRVWVPSLGEKKSEVEAFLSQKSTRPVRIEQLSSEWRGLRPQLRAVGLYLLSEDGRKTAIQMDSVDIQLALLPLLRGEVVLDKLVLRRPALAITRFEDGRIEIGDIEPGQQTRSGDDHPVVEWLLRQRIIQIEDGVLTWHDRQSGENPMEISDVQLALRNSGDQHRFRGSASLPETIARELSLEAGFEGAPLIDARWSGHISLDVADLNVAGLPQILRERLPEGLNGRIGTQSSYAIADDGLHEASGTLAVSDLELALPGLRTPLTARSLKTDFDWERDGSRSELQLEKLGLWFEDRPWSAGRLSLTIDSEARRTRFSVERVRMQELVNLIGKLRNENRAVQAVRELQPAGEAHNLDLQVEGNWREPEAFRLRARLVDASVRPYRKFPGLTAVNGVLGLNREGGFFEIDSRDATVEFPEIFAAPLPVDYARGRIRWTRHADHWRIYGDDLELGNVDGRGTGAMEVTFPRDREISPTLRLDVKFRDGNGAAAARYLPVHRLKPAVTDWLKSALVGGRIEDGSLHYHGKVREFPFDDHPGEFTIEARVSEAVVAYDPDWPRVEKGRGKLEFDRSSMTVTGDSARIGGQDADNILVRIDNLKDPEKVVAVNGRVTGPLEPAMKFLQQGPLFPAARSALSGMTLTGNGELELKLDIPVSAASQAQVQGRYRLRDAILQVTEGIQVAGINSEVEFTDQDVSTGPISATLLGAPVMLEVHTPQPGRPPVVVVQGQGHMEVSRLTPLLHPEIIRSLSGSAQWDGQLRFDDTGAVLTIQSDLTGVESDAPAPLNKTARAAWPFTAVTRFSGDRGREVRFAAGDRVSGLLRYPASEASGEISGIIRVGEGSLPPVPAGGLGVHVSGIQLDLDPWVDYLQPVMRRQPDDGQGLRYLSGAAGVVKFRDRRFNEVSVTASRSETGHWRGSLRALELAGEFEYSHGDRRNLALELDYLHWPRNPKSLARKPGPHEWRALPTLDVRARSFRYGEMNLGELRFAARPDPGGWDVSQLRCERPQTTVAASGRWNIDGNSEMSRYNITVDSRNVGDSLADLGVGRRVEGGRARVEAQVSWAGGPGSFSLAGTTAEISVDARDGRFPQLDPGAGRLFGLFNIDALTRRLRLDFSDIFNKGFAFDRIRGALNISNGAAVTRNLQITGPSADIAVSGRSGIVTEDYDLEIVVTPEVGSNLAVAGGVLGSPAAGAAIFLFQKVFKKQLGDLVKYRYLVTGPWHDPAMTRVETRSQG